jgi:hypothetical protein
MSPNQQQAAKALISGCFVIQEEQEEQVIIINVSYTQHTKPQYHIYHNIKA